MLEMATLVEIETTAAIYEAPEPGDVTRETKRFHGVSRLKLTIADPSSATGSVTRTFLCVEGDEEARLARAMDAVGAHWG